MAELVREIEAVDIPKLKELMKLVFGDDEWKDIQRLGGMTNHSYKITRNDGEEYLVRIPGDGTEEMINRMDERKSTELGCKLGIDSPLLYFGDDGRKVMKFIHDPQEMNEEVMRRKKRFIAAKMYVDYLWTLWGLTRVPFDGDFMQEYADGRYIRLKKNIEAYKKLD